MLVEDENNKIPTPRKWLPWRCEHTRDVWNSAIQSRRRRELDDFGICAYYADVMAIPLNPFAAAAQRAVADILEMSPHLFVVGAPPNLQMGDLAVGCFPAAKALRAAPQALALRVEESFRPNEFLMEASAAGPFVNFKLNRRTCYHSLFTSIQSPGDLLSKEPGAGKTICIDFSSPNISKQLAYHHLRSTVLGHALANLYRSIGYRVISINHLGDWGTTHGMLLAAYHNAAPPEPLTIATLNAMYVGFRAAMADDPSLEEEGRRWFAKLENGDKSARALWQTFKDISWAEFQRAYDLLGIQFDEVKGESEFVNDIPGVLQMLDDKKLSSISEGALVVMLDDEGDMPPLLLRKSDGATLYATRDLAAAEYRWKTYQFERSLYVVDRGQGLHFKQLFCTLKKAGYEWASRCHHVSFGLVRVGGKKTGTSKGNVVLLNDVLAEAKERAATKISSNNPTWSQQQIDETSVAIGVGAIVFANLVSQREKDLDFDWEEVLSTSGDSGPYVQYGHARCCRILSLGGGEPAPSEVNWELLSNEPEWALALRLAQLGDIVVRATDTNDPHLLSRYLLDLVAVFSSWYTQGNQDKSLRILCEDQAVKNARLALVAITRAVLREGLTILGLRAPAAM